MLLICPKSVITSHRTFHFSSSLLTFSDLYSFLHTKLIILSPFVSHKSVIYFHAVHSFSLALNFLSLTRSPCHHPSSLHSTKPLASLPYRTFPFTLFNFLTQTYPLPSCLCPLEVRGILSHVSVMPSLPRMQL